MSIEEKWKKYLQQANMDHMEAFVTAFPERKINPELDRLVKIVETNPRMRTVDKADLSQRIQMVSEKAENNLDQLSDIQTGRMWNWSALELAHQQGVVEYQVIAEIEDKANPPCDVCLRIHGKTFPVDVSRDKMTVLIEMASGDKITRIDSFPQLEDVDNISSKEMRGMVLHPPFHPNCRCQIVLLWKGA
jgi:hypothetical protein